MKSIKKVWDYWNTYGTTVLWLKLVKKRKVEFGDYQNWIGQNELTDEEKNRQQNCLFPFMPKISVAVPVFQTQEKFLREMIESVQNQTYGNWELCIADGSPDDHTSRIVQEYCYKDQRIKLKHLKKNYGIVGNSNHALAMCSGSYIGLLDHDDVLAVNALFEVIKAINSHKDAGLLYSDEDKMSMNSLEYFDPHFKSNFNLDLLRSNNYICHFCVIKTEIIHEIGGFREEFEGAQDYDIILRSIEKTESVVHIPKILYHWRCHKDSTAENPNSKLFAYEAGKKAIEEHLIRMGEKGDVFFTRYLGFYHIKYELKEHEKVTVIILDKNKEKFVKRCRKSIIQTSGYDNFSFIIVKKWEDIDWNALESKYVLLVNSLVRMISKDWMKDLLAICQRKDVKAVGIKLIDKKSQKIYHAGMIAGMNGYAFQGFPRELCENFHRDEVTQNVSAVSMDFIMVSKTDFLNISKCFFMHKNQYYGKLKEINGLVVIEAPIEAYIQKNIKDKQYIGGSDLYYNCNLSLEAPGYCLKTAENNQEQQYNSYTKTL